MISAMQLGILVGAVVAVTILAALLAFWHLDRTIRDPWLRDETDERKAGDWL